MKSNAFAGSPPAVPLDEAEGPPGGDALGRRWAEEAGLARLQGESAIRAKARRQAPRPQPAAGAFDRATLRAIQSE